MARRTFVFAAVLVLALSVLASADWDDGDPYKWLQLPDLQPTGMDVNATFPFVLADDFLCTETGPIEGIHVWGSWYQDYLPYGDPTAVSFTLSIHADIPADESPTGYSMPGELLWMMDFNPGEFQPRIWEEGLQEGWLNPPDMYVPLGDTVCWQYNFTIIGDLAFVQQGSAANPIVYWLDVQARPDDIDAYFGWKTSVDHWNDDAVWGQGEEPNITDWWELRYPEGHPWYPESIDLAFVIAGEAEPPLLDCGDAPDPTYPTFAASGGPAHPIVPGFQMGMLIDSELNGQPNFNATGDDIAGTADEDGVTFVGAMIPGNTAGVKIDMMSSGMGGFIDAWVDFNSDGGWAELGDQILTSVWVAAGTAPTLNFNVPVGATAATTFARFRLSSSGGLSYGGMAVDGEVEDYEVSLEAPDDWKWIQTPDLGETGIDINCTEPYILADDFLCTEPGRLTNIDVWGSWLDDYIPFGEDPYGVKFTLSIHEDIPAPVGGYSMPGEVLWVRDFIPGEFTASIWQDQILEGWMNPPEEYWFPADTICWLYSFVVPREEAFHQVGMPDSNIIYWLDVQAQPMDVDALFGWKTTLDNWNDDAVWGWGMEPYPGPWQELIYPPNHALAGHSIDLAFALKMDYGTGVPDEIPTSYDLRQNVPNPFNPKTTIHYEVPAGGGHVTIEIYDVAGRLVTTLVDGLEPEGEQSVVWDGKDTDGKQMATGVYFYRMNAEDIESSKKMLLLK